MRRGLDHVVHIVRDLDAAGEIYDLIGFTVGARNRHPWGTENRIVQTDGFYMELLQVTEAEKVPPHSDAGLSFGAFNKAFLEKDGEGLSMMAFEGYDSTAEKAEFDEAGFGGFDVFDFSRQARRFDGQDVEVAFSLAFARDPHAPDLGAFTCHQKKPENFWSQDLQRHANNVTGLAGVVLVSDSPADHLAFLETVSGVGMNRASDDWFVGQTPRGQIDLMTRPLFTERYGVPAPGQDGMRLGAVRFSSPGAPELRRALAARRMVEEAIEGMVVVPPRAAMGATLVFELTE